MNYALFGGLDEDILALPFYEEQHRTFAVELADWCAGHAGLWSRPLEQTPEKAGREILSALGSAGWLGFLDPANGSAAGDQRSICLARRSSRTPTIWRTSPSPYKRSRRPRSSNTETVSSSWSICREWRRAS